MMKILVFFEYEFDIGFITYNKSSHLFNKKIEGLVIDSTILKNWIGHTTTQNKILENIGSKNFGNIDRCEFKTKLNNYGALGLSYKITSGYDSFSSTKKSHPEFIILFESPKDIESIHDEIKKIYNLLIFFIGYDFDINSVKLLPYESFNTQKVSAYFSWNFPTKLDYTLFPLGHNLKFDQLELPSLPLISFDKYYNLSEADLTLYSRYHGYSRMKSDEEKFLGFFRLLEKLTYQVSPYVSDESLDKVIKTSKSYLQKRLQGKPQDIKAFLKRIPHLNKSKYNTQTCISKFYDRLPIQLTEKISFKKQDLQEICKLRNDITHANHFLVTEEKLYKFTLFIKVLLYLALLEKIGIDIQIYWKIATRFENFYSLQSNEIKTTKIE